MKNPKRSGFGSCFSSIAIVLCLVAAIPSSSAFAGTSSRKPKVHVIAPGHTLGKVAKRYHISIEQLCQTNRLTPRSTLKPGQRLIIPQPENPSEQQPPTPTTPTSAGNDEPQSDPPGKKSEWTTSSSKQRQPEEIRWYTTHVVANGHTLGKLADRYHSTVKQIQQANGLLPHQIVKTGTCLVIPLSERHYRKLRNKTLPCLTDELRAKQQASLQPSTISPKQSELTYHSYSHRPSQPGTIHLVRGSATFRGRVINGKGQAITASVEKVNALLFDRRTNATHSTDLRLLAILTRLSDFFGGRRLIVVSGYRQESSNRYTTRSNHALGKAIDFRIEGVPNEALRDYCHTLAGVGVGYYPNSSFIHLDVREITTHWTDISGPGEAPKYISVEAIPSRPAGSSVSASRATHRRARRFTRKRPVSSTPQVTNGGSNRPIAASN